MKYLKYLLTSVLATCAAFSIISPAAAAVPHITGIESTGAGLVITWNLAEGADLYGVFRREKEGKWECIAWVPAEDEIEEAPDKAPKTETATEAVASDAESDVVVTEKKETYAATGTWIDSRIIPGEEYLYCVRGYNNDTKQWSRIENDGTAGTWEVTPDRISAGTILTEEAVAVFGEDTFFYVEEISDETFARMWTKSFKEYCTIDRADLRYIRCLHKDIDGNIKVGELVMHMVVADTVCGIFRQLYDAAYPIESMILIDEFDADDETSIMSNNTSAFNYRTVDNTDEISNHAYGLAIDINPYYNVYYIPSANYIFPPEGWAYLDREADFPYKLMPGDLCYNLFTEAGFEWGGWWTYNTDYQHFQYIY